MKDEVTELSKAVEGIVALLRADSAFTKAEEEKIASVMGKLRDAFGRWRARKRKP